jgi:hypothetical protein
MRGERGLTLETAVKLMTYFDLRVATLDDQPGQVEPPVPEPPPPAKGKGKRKGKD